MTVPEEENRGLMGYVRVVTNSVNPHELQRWAVGILSTNDWSATKELRINAATTTTGQDLSSSLIAIPTLGHAPAQVSLNGPTKENGYTPSMRVLYLGGFGSWAIHVGDESFYMSEDRYCYEWIPGVYIVIYP